MRYIRGWRYFLQTLYAQWRKRKRGVRYEWSQMIYVAKCARWIVAQQHRPELNPALSLWRKP